MNQEKIIKLFNALSAGEQDSLLIELNRLKKKLVIDTEDISKFASRHQKEYGKDITFTITKEEEIISATLHTVFGNFTGSGINQKIAKLNAVKLANETWD